MRNLILLLLFIFVSQNLYSSGWRKLGEISKFNKTARYVENMICVEPDYFLTFVGNGNVYLSTDQGRSWDSVYRFSQAFYQFYIPNPDCQYYISYSRVELGSYYKYLDRINDNFAKIERIISNPPSQEEVFLGSPTMLDCKTGLLNSYSRIYDETENYMVVTFDGWETYERRDIPLYFWRSGRSHLLSDGNIVFYSGGTAEAPNIKGQDTVIRGAAIVNYNFYKDEWTKLYEFPLPDSIKARAFPKGPNVGSQFLNDTTIIGIGTYDLREMDEPNYNSEIQKNIIYKSTDGGYSWNILMDTLMQDMPFSFQRMDFYDERNGVIVGRYGKVMMTNDGGESWHYEDRDWFREGIYPPVMYVQFAGQFPIIGTRLGGNMYRYEGDFFIFDFKAPDLFFPKQNTVKHEQDIQFRWEELRDATSYSFRLATDSDFNDIIKEHTANEMNVSYDGLDYFTEYYWQVSSSNDEETMWSDTYTFRTRMPDVQTIEPQCYSEQYPRNIKFEWTAVKGAENYRLRLATNQNFTENLILIEDLETQNYEIEVLESLASYFWQVQAYRSDETGDWSELCTFTTTQDTVSVRNLSNAIKIYPNPTKDKIYIQTTIFLSRIELSDVLGNVVISDLTPTLSKGEGVSINVENLPAGMYFLKLYTMSGEVLVEKVMVGF